MPEDSFEPQRRKLAELAASLDARARELLVRQAAVERKEAELRPREASVVEKERRLQTLGDQLNAIKQELTAKAQDLMNREAELRRRESEVAERERMLDERGRELAQLRTRERIGEERSIEMEALRRAEEARAIFETKTAEVMQLAEELRAKEELLAVREGGMAGAGGDWRQEGARVREGASGEKAEPQAPAWLPPILAAEWSMAPEAPAAPISEAPPPPPIELPPAAVEMVSPEVKEAGTEAGRAAALSEGDARDLLARAERAISEARRMGGDADEASQMLSSGYELLGERRYGEAGEAARTALELARGALKGAEAHRRAQAVESARKVVEDVKQLGIRVAEAEQLLDMAVAALQRAEHELAVKYAHEAEAKARQTGEGFSRASDSLRSLDTILRESQRRQAEHDLSEVEAMKLEAKAAFDRGDYAGAYELARKAERRLHELQLLFQQGLARPAAAPGHGAPAQAPATRPQKYKCPTCGKPFQVTPPEKRPFEVACPWCGSRVRISR